MEQGEMTRVHPNILFSLSHTKSRNFPNEGRCFIVLNSSFTSLQHTHILSSREVSGVRAQQEGRKRHLQGKQTKTHISALNSISEDTVKELLLKPGKKFPISVCESQCQCVFSWVFATDSHQPTNYCNTSPCWIYCSEISR